MIILIANLTDQKVISDTFWYLEGVRRAQPHAHFAFYEELYKRVDRLETDQGVNDMRNSTKHVFKDMEHFIISVLDRLFNDPSRDQGNIRAIVDAMNKQRGGKQKELLITSVIKIANLITNSINEREGVIIGFLAGKEIRSPLPVLSTQYIAENLGPALLRILYATRGKNITDTKLLEQSFQDRIFADILAFIIRGHKGLKRI